ncbi:MAG: hypothetical protein BHV81_09470 [Butyricimonas synergistica]|nr:MAG: hypothetical protein BHV81_09470 [Butyricimonas synergistica]
MPHSKLQKYFIRSSAFNENLQVWHFSSTWWGNSSFFTIIFVLYDFEKHEVNTFYLIWYNL